MRGSFRLFGKPGYAVYIAFLCLTLFCLPFVSPAPGSGVVLGTLSLYLFLVWLFLILNLFCISRSLGSAATPPRHDETGEGP